MTGEFSGLFATMPYGFGMPAIEFLARVHGMPPILLSMSYCSIYSEYSTHSASMQV
ncbi:hypothetical protein KAR91_35020 [Candidatus Pacearchaeota archaeon]|nr:hypothetical protein [Candidatus Pacearchaeota archaeon]